MACSIPNCQQKVHVRGWCNAHYIRWYRYGNPLEPRRRKPNGAGWISNGYRRITVNGKIVLEHRHIMEKLLGRRLHEGEMVHHKNGRKQDNRPQNLEHMTRGQHLVVHRIAFKHHIKNSRIFKLRSRGLSWKRIGAIVGMSDQGARYRFHHFPSPASLSIRS